MNWTPLPKKSTGGGPLGDVIDRHSRNIEERTPIAGQNVWFQQVKGGFIINAGGSSGKPLSISIYSVLATRADYLVCTPYDITTGAHNVNGQNVNVAKWWDMQQSYYHNKTIDGYRFTGIAGASFLIDRLNPYVRRTRTAVSHPSHARDTEITDFVSGVTWTEMVDPPYYGHTGDGSGGYSFYGAIIMAFDLPTPIELPAVVGEETTDPATTIRKMEIPIRSWVPIERNVTICENNTRRRIKIRASDSFAL
jgi:hypothetical protein